VSVCVCLSLPPTHPYFHIHLWSIPHTHTHRAAFVSLEQGVVVWEWDERDLARVGGAAAVADGAVAIVGEVRCVVYLYLYVNNAMYTHTTLQTPCHCYPTIACCTHHADGETSSSRWLHTPCYSCCFTAPLF
jgi:hypothetical protein